MNVAPVSGIANGVQTPLAAVPVPHEYVHGSLPQPEGTTVSNTPGPPGTQMIGSAGSIVQVGPIGGSNSVQQVAVMVWGCSAGHPVVPGQVMVTQ